MERQTVVTAGHNLRVALAATIRVARMMVPLAHSAPAATVATTIATAVVGVEGGTVAVAALAK
jgi:type IV secretory pathway VirB2 component (pilin)